MAQGAEILHQPEKCHYLRAFGSVFRERYILPFSLWKSQRSFTHLASQWKTTEWDIHKTRVPRKCLLSFLGGDEIFESLEKLNRERQIKRKWNERPSLTPFLVVQEGFGGALFRISPLSWSVSFFQSQYQQQREQCQSELSEITWNEWKSWIGRFSPSS